MDLKGLFQGDSFISPGSIGGKIKRYREMRGLTQKELGILCGFTPSTADVRIAQYEKNKKLPREKVLKDMAAALGLEEHALYDADLFYHEQMYHILFDLEDLHGLHPVKGPYGYQLAFGGSTIRKREVKKYEYDSFLEDWYKKRQEYLPEESDSQATIDEKVKEYTLWRGEYPLNVIKEAADRRDDITRMAQLQAEMDALNAKMKSDEEFERINSVLDGILPDHQASFVPIKKESDLIYLIKKLMENGIKIEDYNPVRPYENSEEYFHLLSVKTADFLNDNDKAVLFAELYSALESLKDVGIKLDKKINSLNNELYISYYCNMEQYNYFSNLLKYWDDIIFILDKQSHWSEPELADLEEKFREKITGENDVVY